MDREAQVLLVSRRALIAGFVAGSASLVSGCGQSRGPAQTVRARDYDAFFLWAGVPAPDWLGSARTVYLLAGEVRAAAGSAFTPLRAVPHVRGPKVWCTVRVERLDWEESVYTAVLSSLQRWATGGSQVIGLQIDFDAATRGLGHYAAFLTDLRKRLDPRWQLSITGLLDWSAGGSAANLAQLGQDIDEIVVQTYQGRQTIGGYERYLRSLDRLGIAFRIGLVEGGMWQAPPGLEAMPGFGGYVVFLVNGSG